MNRVPPTDDSDGELMDDALDTLYNGHFSAPTASSRSANSPRGSARLNHAVSDDDDHYDVMADAVSTLSPTSSPQTNQLPLIPSDCDDIQEAHENFLRVFEARYGDKHPIFHPISLMEAYQDVQSANYSVRKPVVMYLHDDNSVLSQIFCTQVLCSPAIIDFLNSNFLLWAWDFTVPENRTKVIEWVEALLGHQRSLQIRVCTTEDFPVLVVLGKVSGTVDIIDIIRGCFSIEQVMAQLMNCLDACQEQIRTEALEDEARQKREQMRNEQENAYNESLQADKLKEEMRLKEEKKTLEEQKLKLEAEKKKEENRQRIEAHLQSEPTENCPHPVTKIRIRTLDGQNLERRFLMSQPLSHLFDFVASKNYCTSEYKLLTSFPKRDLTSLDSKKTFVELNFGPREAIVMEAR